MDSVITIRHLNPGSENILPLRDAELKGCLHEVFDQVEQSRVEVRLLTFAKISNLLSQ